LDKQPHTLGFREMQGDSAIVSHIPLAILGATSMNRGTGASTTPNPAAQRTRGKGNTMHSTSPARRWLLRYGLMMRAVLPLLGLIVFSTSWAQPAGGPEPIKKIGDFMYRCKGSLAGNRATWLNEPGNEDGKNDRVYTIIYQSQCLSYIQGFIHGHSASAQLSDAFTNNKAAVTHICPPAGEPVQSSLVKAIAGLQLLQQLRTQKNPYNEDSPIETPLLTALMNVYPCKDLPLGQPRPKP